MKTVLALLVLIGIGYAFYAGVVAVYQYMQVKDIVEEAVRTRAKVDKYERPGWVKDDILRKAPEAGVSLDERAVLVSDENGLLRVTIRWSYPMVVYRGETVLSVPLSYDKSFQPKPY